MMIRKRNNREIPGRSFPQIRAQRLLFLMGLLLFVAGCQISSRVRTLPEEIQSVYVPIFINITTKPGLEEIVGRATVEAFLSDGRLDVVSSPMADVIVQGIIQDFSDNVSSAESDDFPMMNTMTMRVIVKLYSPDDRLNPLHVFKPFVITRSYVSDVRRSTMVIPEDAREGLMSAVGEKVVQEVITGGFKEIRNP